MRSLRCPKCGRYIFYNERTDSDVIHQCTKADGTRLQRKEEKHHQGTRVTLKMDEKDWWDQMGINPPQPNKKLKKARFKDQFKTDTNVDYYIEVGG